MGLHRARGGRIVGRHPGKKGTENQSEDDKESMQPPLEPAVRERKSRGWTRGWSHSNGSRAIDSGFLGRQADSAQFSATGQGKKKTKGGGQAR